MQREDYRNTLIVMAGLAAATVSGFLREAVLAHQLGASRQTDIYLVAFAVPEFVFVALPIVLSPAFLPLFVRSQQANESSARRFGLQTAGALTLSLLAFTVIANWGAPLYLAWLAPGFNPVELVQATQATRLMLPGITLMGLAVLAGTTLQVYRRFARPAMITGIYNLTFVLVLLTAPLAYGVARAAWGVSLGAAAALALQVPLLWQVIHAARERPDSHPLLGGARGERSCAPSATVGELARLAGPLAAGYAIHHLILFVDRAMATAMGGGCAATLNYAYRLALAVGQLSGLAVSTTLFPNLAGQIAAGDSAGARASLADALRFTWMVGLAASAGLIVLRVPLVSLLLERGAFDSAATAAVSQVLRWYALSVLADAVCQPLWRVIYAQRRAGTVIVVNGLQTSLRLVGNIALSRAFGYNGLAMAAALGLSVQAVVLAWLAWHCLGGYLSHRWWKDIALITLAAAAASAAVAVLNARLAAAPAWLTLLSCGTLGGGVYLSALAILGYRNSLRN
ncbi:MAG: polysaccharide biosynthesis C-terminal domain-containing protein [Thermoflexales bacterium]|nr:polysaccharide biosynthesis C-terminal domain-containing protein [Thermoflexales bacterium]